MKKVVILGAGLSGLGCALQVPGARVFEAADHPGGLAYSHRFDGIAFDEGGHICHSRDGEWVELITRQAGDVKLLKPSRVGCYWHGHWFTYPVQNHLPELPSEVREPALRDFRRAQKRTSVAEPRNYREWCISQYGEYMTDRFYAEYTAKYWRTPMEDMATDWLPGRLLPADARRVLGAASSGSDDQPVFAAFRYPARGGFYAFVQPLYDRIDVRCGHRACGIDPRGREVVFENGVCEAYETLVSTIPLPDLVGMIPDAPSEVRAAAVVLRNLQEVCVNVVLSKPSPMPYHWFYVYDHDVECSRITLVSNVAPASVGGARTALQAEVFRRADEPMPAAELAEKAVAGLARILGFDAARDVVSVNPVAMRRSYVISDHRRAPAVAAIVPWLRNLGIRTIGLFGLWEYVWSDVAFQRGEAEGRRVLESAAAP